jgi:hypothetical protein
MGDECTEMQYECSTGVRAEGRRAVKVEPRSARSGRGERARQLDGREAGLTVYLFYSLCDPSQWSLACPVVPMARKSWTRMRGVEERK